MLLWRACVDYKLTSLKGKMTSEDCGSCVLYVSGPGYFRRGLYTINWSLKTVCYVKFGYTDYP